MNDRAAHRILVIDDESTHRILAKEYLEDAGFVVRLVEDGPRGLRMAKRLIPDLILVDLMIPGMDGLELCRLLRSDATTAHIPVILITGSREPDVIARGFAAGVDDFVTKPVDWEFISDRVDHVLAKAQKSRLAMEAREGLDQRHAGDEGQHEAGSEFNAGPKLEAGLPAKPDAGAEAEIESVRRSAEAERQAMEIRYAGEIEALQQALAAERIEAAGQLEAERGQHAEAMEQLRSAHVAELAAARETAAAQAVAEQASAVQRLEQLLAGVRLETDASKRALELEAAQRLSSAEDMHARQISALRNRSEAALLASRSEMEQERAKLVAGHTQRIEQMERRAQEQLSAANDSIAKVRSEAAAEARNGVTACWDFARSTATDYADQVRAIAGHVHALSSGQMWAADGQDGAAPDLAELNRSVRILSNSLSTMRMLAQVMAGKSTLHETAFDLRDVVKEAASHTRALAAANKVEVQLDLPNDPVVVEADEARITYAALSLVMNAIGHSAHGSTVNLTIAALDGDDVAIRIEDHGVGMAPALVQGLRTCLDQATWPSSDQKIGLGIPTSMALARLHGGSLELDSNLGRGTCATFRLPAGRRRQPGMLPADRARAS